MSTRSGMSALALCMFIVAIGAVPTEAADAAAGPAPAAFTKLAALDWVVIAGYFGIIALLVVWSFMKNKDTAERRPR